VRRAAATAPPEGGLSYKAAGVDIDAGDELVKRIQKLNPSIGGFSGMVPFGDSFLVAGTDGVGTKLKLAFDMNKHDTVGIDLVAMSVNDIITSGAQPLFFLDYFATGFLDVDTAEQVGHTWLDGTERILQASHTAGGVVLSVLCSDSLQRGWPPCADVYISMQRCVTSCTASWNTVLMVKCICNPSCDSRQPATSVDCSSLLSPLPSPNNAPPVPLPLPPSPRVVSDHQVIKGIVEGCRQSGCQLLGGETAEMPGFYTKGEYDLAGFAVGSVKKDKAITGEGHRREGGTQRHNNTAPAQHAQHCNNSSCCRWQHYTQWAMSPLHCALLCHQGQRKVRLWILESVRQQSQLRYPGLAVELALPFSPLTPPASLPPPTRA